jgi:hypothetical protein
MQRQQQQAAIGKRQRKTRRVDLRPARARKIAYFDLRPLGDPYDVL